MAKGPSSKSPSAGVYLRHRKEQLTATNRRIQGGHALPHTQLLALASRNVSTGPVIFARAVIRAGYASQYVVVFDVAVLL